MDNSNSIPIFQFSAPTETSLVPHESSQPIQTPSYRLSPRLIALVQSLSFSGEGDENPYLHIRDFEQTCDCLRIEGMSDKTLRWKLFPFSLKGKARQWYDKAVGKQQGDWGSLRSNFCLDFYPISQIVDLRVKVLTIKQEPEESLASSWNRFTTLLASGPDLSLPDPILLQHFYKGLSRDSRKLLDTTSGGSFLHISAEKARSILDQILSSELDYLLEVEPQVAEDKHLPDTPSTSANPCLEQDKEDIPLPDFMLDIEPDLFSNFGNIFNYHKVKKPQGKYHPIKPCNIDEDIPTGKTSGELVSVMSNEWLEESELSSEIIRLDSSSLPIHCMISNDRIDALYNPVVGINIMSTTLAKYLQRNMTLTPTVKFIRNLSRQILPCLGILHVLPLRVEGTPVHLSFYVFDIGDFHLLIGQPFRRLLYEGQTGKLNICLGKKLQFAMSISHSLNAMTEPHPHYDPLEEFRAASLEFLVKPELEDEARFFIEEEADPSENEPLDEFTLPPRPPIEFKPLPAGLRYAFLGNDPDTPVIISDTLTQEQTFRLMAVLEKHKKAFGYSLQDLKGISPALCTHRIPTDPDIPPSREPQRRLNNAMREVVKKEVLKLLHAGIIYPVPHSEWVSPVQVVPKKGGMTVVQNEKNELIPQRTITGWRMCIDYRKLNKATRKDHFPLPFIDEMLERLANHSYFCFLDGYSGYHQIPIHPNDQNKTTFTCPYGTFAYRRMSFGLCNAPASFQRCMMSIFSDMIEKIMEVFMDDFFVYGKTFDECLKNIDRVLQRCEEKHLVLNWEKCHFMVREGIVLGHLVSERGIEVDRAKIEVI